MAHNLEDIYTENLGQPTEWDTDTLPIYGIGDMDYDSLDESHNGVKSVKLKVIRGSGYTNTTGIEIDNLLNISFWIKLPSNYQDDKITVRIQPTENYYDSATYATSAYIDELGGNPNNTNWQKLVIDRSRWDIYTPTVIKRINIIVADLNNQSNIVYIDDIQYQTGGVIPDNPNTISITPTGLESIDEGNGNGLVKVGRTSANYGNIGLNAVDLSFSDSVSSTLGATGEDSFTGGYLTTASGNYSHAEGSETVASGEVSHAEGVSTIASGIDSHSEGASTTASGSISHAGGIDNQASSFAERAIGSYGTVYTPTSTNSWSALDRLFNVGNGTSSGTRSDAFTILKNGYFGIGYDNFETTTSTELLQVNGSIHASSSIVTDTNFGMGVLVPTYRIHAYRDDADELPFIQLENDGLGDASIGFLRTDIQGWSMGIDGTDNEFKISTSQNDVGTNTKVTISPSSGNVELIGSIKVGDDTDSASIDKVGAIRYRSDANNSYMDMCMQTGASTYAWVNIKTNSW